MCRRRRRAGNTLFPNCFRILCDGNAVRQSEADCQKGTATIQRRNESHEFHASLPSREPSAARVKQSSQRETDRLVQFRSNCLKPYYRDQKTPSQPPQVTFRRRCAAINDRWSFGRCGPKPFMAAEAVRLRKPPFTVLGACQTDSKS